MGGFGRRCYDGCLIPCVTHPAVTFCFNTIRWIPVLLITGVMCWGYYAYVYELCLVTVQNLVEKIVYLVVFHFLFIMFFWSYYQTIFSEIGQPPPLFYLPRDVKYEAENAENSLDVRHILERFSRQQELPLAMRAFDGSIRFCDRCHCVKPDRSHHCSVCGCCVLKFDHHCPWVNTYVNYRNYKFFVQFLGYALVFCLWGFFTDMKYFIAFWQGGDYANNVQGRFHILFMFFVAGMFAISVSCLFFYHLYLTSRNQSTIESFRAPVFTYGPDKKGYNIGVRRNFRQVFGDKPLLWFLPVFSSNGNGVIFPLRSEMIDAQSLLTLSRRHHTVPLVDSGSSSAGSNDDFGPDHQQQRQSLINAHQRTEQQQQNHPTARLL